MKARVLLIGAEGRLGSLILAHGGACRDLKIVGSVTSRNRAEFLSLLKKSKANVVLDVSSPSATLNYLRILKDSKVQIPYVIGVTGFSKSEHKLILNYAKFAKKHAVLLVPNFAESVTLLLSILQKIAPAISKLGYGATLVETHHVHKKDKPSGTAKALAESLKPITPLIESIRVGEVIGVHEVRFESDDDILTLRHEAKERSLFAKGALHAAQWAAKTSVNSKKIQRLHAKSQWLLNMTHVLELESVPRHF